MNTLEEALRLAAQKGMTHLTLYPVESDDRKTTYWHARCTPSTGHSYVQTTSTDPVEAVVQVLAALPKAPKRSAPAKGYHTAGREPSVDDAVTATVTAPKPPADEDINSWLPQA